MDSALLDSLISKNDRDDETSTELNCDDDFLASFSLILFTDGACSGNGKNKSRTTGTAGYGVYTYEHARADKRSHPLAGIKLMQKLQRRRFFSYVDTSVVMDGKYKIINGGKTGVSDDIPFCSEDDCDESAKYAPVNAAGPRVCYKHKKAGWTQHVEYVIFGETNVRAEGLAILLALRTIFMHASGCRSRKQLWESVNEYPSECNRVKVSYACKDIYDTSKPQKYMIVSDSKLWIDIVCNWGAGWIRKNMVLERKNQDIFIWINNVVCALEDIGVNVFMQHIHGHADTRSKSKELNIYQRGNVLVDKLATHAVTLGSTKLTLM